MMFFIVNVLPWIMSFVTVYSMFLAGSKAKAAWELALVNQVLWLVYIVGTHAWGLLPMNFALWYVYFRNLNKWS